MHVTFIILRPPYSSQIRHDMEDVIFFVSHIGVYVYTVESIQLVKRILAKRVFYVSVSWYTSTDTLSESNICKVSINILLLHVYNLYYYRIWATHLFCLMPRLQAVVRPLTGKIWQKSQISQVERKITALLMNTYYFL